MTPASDKTIKELESNHTIISKDQIKDLIKNGKLKSPSLIGRLLPDKTYVIKTFSATIPIKTKACYIQYDSNHPHEIYFSEDKGETYNYISSDHHPITLEEQ